MNALPLSRVIWLTASATPEFGTSTITSTLSTSYHWRATCEPTSGLFWWSAEMISTFMPFLAAPKSSTAMRAASTEPWPGEVGVEARLVVEHADLDHAVGDLRLRAHRARRREAYCCNSACFDFIASP